MGVAFGNRTIYKHNLIYTPKILRGMLNRHGFEVKEISFFENVGKLGLLGKIYNKIFLRFFPLFASRFGIVAVKKTGKNHHRRRYDERLGQK